MRKPFEALGALKWLFAAMQPLVLFKMVFVFEGFWTLFALMWPQVRRICCLTNAGLLAGSLGAASGRLFHAQVDRRLLVVIVVVIVVALVVVMVNV